MPVRRHCTENGTRVRLTFEALDLAAARRLLAELVNDFGECAPKAVEQLEEAFADALAVLAVPEPYWKRLRTGVPLGPGQERLNEEIRRWERVIRIFPKGDRQNSSSGRC